MKKEIKNLDDIRLLVDSFYERIRQDELLGKIFNNVIQDRWPEHLEKMYRFWQTVLLEEHTYHGSPFMPHAKLPVSTEHFEHWMNIFTKTVDDLFHGPKADEAKWRAGKMAEMFDHKIRFYQANPNRIVL